MAGRCFGRARSLAGLLALTVACTSAKPAPSKAESIARGDELLQRKAYAEAAAAYRDAVTADSADGRLRMKLTDAYIRAGAWSQAAAQSLRAADLLPNDPEAQLLAAKLILGQGRYVDVVDRMDSLLRVRPNEVNALILWGNATAHLINSTLALERLPEAIADEYKYAAARRRLRPDTAKENDVAAEKALKKARDLAPDDVEAQQALANLLWAIGRPDEAHDTLKALADKYPNFPLVHNALGAYYFARHRDKEGERFLRSAAAAGEAGREARLALTGYYIATKRDDDAMAILKSMLPADDASGDVSLRMASLEFRAGKREKAMSLVEQVLGRQPHNVPALLLKAQFLLAGKDWDGAQRAARAALAENPQSKEAHTALGQILSATGNIEGAFAELSEALRLGPDAEDLSLPLAQLSISLGRNEEAVQFARDAKRRNPDDPQAALALVTALVRTRDYLGADRELKPLLKRPPSPEVLVQLGAVQAALNNLEMARATFTQALQANPESLDALSGLVSVELKSGRVASARQRVDQSLTAHANDPVYLLLAAKVYRVQKDMALTEQTLRQVLMIDPANVNAAIWLSEELGREHQGDAAGKVLEQLLEHRPQSEDAQLALARRLELDGKIEEARKRYENIVALNPDAAQAARRLAAIYVEQSRNLDIALNLASTAKRLLPQDPDVMDTLGWVYVAKNQWPQAARHLSDAVQSVPNNPVYRYHLGVAYLRSGSLKRAESEFQQALKIEPNYQFAEQTRALLASMRK